ncbi:MAG TPA: hypothetical protein VHF88_09170 [Thermoleophilaceae bacterium]|nr:hypothetical protein [Thermoleophilaceae bacterium]
MGSERPPAKRRRTQTPARPFWLAASIFWIGGGVAVIAGKVLLGAALLLVAAAALLILRSLHRRAKGSVDRDHASILDMLGP